MKIEKRHLRLVGRFLLNLVLLVPKVVSLPLLVPFAVMAFPPFLLVVILLDILFPMPPLLSHEPAWKIILIYSRDMTRAWVWPPIYA